jgi:Raf kinase inhibitor-like YbhB/YbcL family protein
MIYRKSLLVATALTLAGLSAGCSSDTPAAAPAAPATTAAQGAADSTPEGRPNPYVYLPKVPTFTLTSETVKDGQPLPTAQLSGVFKVPGGQDISPQLSWSGFPASTKSFVVSMYDPEAPTGNGFLHWVVADIPGSATSLPANAGLPASTTLPAGAFQLNGDAGAARYIGGAPPAKSGTHDYYLTVTALDEAKTGGTASTSGALLAFTIGSHVVARATIVCPTVG